jgi:hypothetical protein
MLLVKKRFFLSLTFCVFVFGAACAAAADSGPLDHQIKACEDNVSYFRTQIDHVIAWSNAFMIAGALTAGAGSVFAAVLTKDAHRKAAAFVGALGALITVLPKTLPDKEALQLHLSAAEKHHILGAKVYNQIAFAQADESVVDAKKYASARFTDCASLDPPAAAPDLPTYPARELGAVDAAAAGPAVTAPAPCAPAADAGATKTVVRKFIPTKALPMGLIESAE